MLTTINFNQDSYIFYENDMVDTVYFLSNGAAGYVLPFKRNIVYVEIDEGDDLGMSDIIEYENQSEEEIIQNLE
jgi:hypothetical protein